MVAWPAVEARPTSFCFHICSKPTSFRHVGEGLLLGPSVDGASIWSAWMGQTGCNMILS